MRARWYLIIVNLDITAHLDLKLEQIGMYHVAFITRHPDDKKKRDDEARWCLDWHEYSMDDNDTIIFGHRVLFHPRLSSDKHHNDGILWTDNIPLGVTKYVLGGPYKLKTIHPNQFIDRNILDGLAAKCIVAGIITLTLSKALMFYNRWH